eukprot:990271-Prorocentrum_minimum.AAC.1
MLLHPNTSSFFIGPRQRRHTGGHQRQKRISSRSRGRAPQRCPRQARPPPPPPPPRAPHPPRRTPPPPRCTPLPLPPPPPPP